MVSEITPQLHVSNVADVNRLEPPHKFDRIISVGYPNGNETLRPPESTDDFYIPDGAHDYDIFSNAVCAVRQSLNNDETVLVHCVAGISRSPTVCATALAAEYDIEFIEALLVVQGSRRIADPLPSLIESGERYVDEQPPAQTVDASAEPSCLD